MAAKENNDAGRTTEKPIDKMTVVELRDIAREIDGVNGVHGMKKDELLALVRQHRGLEAKAPRQKTGTKAGKKNLTVKEMKTELVALRLRRDEVRSTGDRKGVNIIRRRINRLKKLTRRPSAVLD